VIEQWQVYEQGMEFSVSDWGRVRNDETGYVLRPSVNQQGIRYVNLKRSRNQTVVRSVAVMVATTFIPETRIQYNAVIHLDGDKGNCTVRNLMWRPRNMAVEYHQQFGDLMREKCLVDPFMELTTGCSDEFDKLMTAGMRFGLLDRMIRANLISNRLRLEKKLPLRDTLFTGHLFAWLR
jgi:hypothetical protein